MSMTRSFPQSRNRKMTRTKRHGAARRPPLLRPAALSYGAAPAATRDHLTPLRYPNVTRSSPMPRPFPSSFPPPPLTPPLSPARSAAAANEASSSSCFEEVLTGAPACRIAALNSGKSLTGPARHIRSRPAGGTAPSWRRPPCGPSQYPVPRAGVQFGAGNDGLFGTNQRSDGLRWWCRRRHCISADRID